MTYTPPDKFALELLDALESEQAKLLYWGVTEGTFSYDEIAVCAGKLLDARGEAATTDAIWSLVTPLLDCGWLWQVTDSDPPLYRTRLAEAVRLFVQLRQMFPGGSEGAWRAAPQLVADYRLLLRARLFPARNISANDALTAVGAEVDDVEAGQIVVDAMLRRGSPDARELAGFQVRATTRILGALRNGPVRSTGTIVCAGTGSGKTLAFYLPALVAIAARGGAGDWTKCLALYPRTELLKDQFREALANVTAINPALRKAGRRTVTVGTLFGDTPSMWQVTQPKKGWKSINRGAEAAFVCPLARCPLCARDLVWLKSDQRKNVERLVCSAVGCNFTAGPDEIRLTRERLLASPPDVLFTTTEMLNQRLGSSKFQSLLGIGLAPARRPILMLLDEVHTNEGVHGAHVAMLIRRWRHLSKASPQMVGLSATLEDAQRFFADLVGISRSAVAEVSPFSSEMRSQGGEYMLALRSDPSSGTSLLSTSIQALMLLRRVLGAQREDSVAGSRVFAFTDNLDVVNRLFHNLRDAEGLTSWGTAKSSAVPLASLRGSALPQHRERLGEGQSWDMVENLGHELTRSFRMKVERTTSQDPGVQSGADIVVATASLEVGFDDPCVGAVLQHKAPRSPASFMQRKGRAGRQRGMRPWTVVVLSDYGRDRAAYQSYEHMFLPSLTPRYLPLANRAMLRMQATYVLFEWLGREMPEAEPWSDLAAPAVNNEALRQRQGAYAKLLRDLLEDEARQRAFSAHVAGALSLNLDADAATLEELLWQPPRPVLMGAAPTLLRRLERSWTRVFSPGKPESSARFGPPLPDFVQRSLFGDLLVPEVEIRTGSEESPTMLVAQALREFAPGRISRRFGIEGRDSHWVDPGEDETLDIDGCCPDDVRDFIGRFEYGSSEGTKQVLVYRPRALLVSTPPSTLLPSSNAFPLWKTQILSTASSHLVDVPTSSPWQDVVRELRFHTHQMGCPIELRRFTPGCRTTLMRARMKAEERELQFISGENRAPSALGFVADVDAIELRFSYPTALLTCCAADGQLLRGLRPARFRDLIRNDARLDGVVNRFQRDWLSEAYLAALTSVAAEKHLTPEQAAAVVEDQGATLRMALERMFQWAPPGDEEGDEEIATADEPKRDDTSGEAGKPRRLGELIGALGDESVRASLRDAAPALWRPVDESWRSWIQSRYKATLSAAMLEAFSLICPQIDASVVFEDLDVHDEPLNDSGNDRIWLTESTIGGGGATEAFFRAYVDDPRRYFRLLESSLGASDLERVASHLERIVEHAAGSDGAPIPLAIAALRAAQGHKDTLASVEALRTVLAAQGIVPDPSLLVAFSVRLLRPGAQPDFDRFLASTLRRWSELEQRLGVDVDVRVFAAIVSRDNALDQAIGVTPPGGTHEAHAVWRYSVLRSLLWTRGGSLRSELLRVANPFLQAPTCDRLLVIGTLPRTIARVALDTPEWFDAISVALTADGVVELVASAEGGLQLAEAMRYIGARPVDTGGLLVHGRLAGVRREATSWVATFELPEAFQ